ncbi:MAG: biotin/lipoate A/B protein ligase family protein, partial [Rhodocyclaceae bacterium]
MKPLFWTDSGTRSGAENAALDSRNLVLAGAGGRETHLRFWASTPTASLGAHQAADRALRLDFCRQAGVAVVRRISGGGAVYLDSSQLGYTLVAVRDAFGPGASLSAVLERFAEGLILGLAHLGIGAQYKWPNDIDVGGRKIASFFAAAEDSAVLLHGTVLLDADVKTMLQALRVPTEKLSPDGLAAARDRLVTVRDCLGEDIDPARARLALLGGLASTLKAEPVALSGDVSPLSESDRDDEVAHALAIDWSGQAAEAVEALVVTDGGPLQARATLTSDGARFARVEFASDCQSVPNELWQRLADALTGAEVAAVSHIVATVLAGTRAETIGFGAEEISRLVALAADKHRVQRVLGLAAQDINTLMVHGSAGESALAILGRASVVLVPYCAKPTWCEWRHEDDCPECGLCA